MITYTNHSIKPNTEENLNDILDVMVPRLKSAGLEYPDRIVRDVIKNMNPTHLGILTVNYSNDDEIIQPTPDSIAVLHKRKTVRSFGCPIILFIMDTKHTHAQLIPPEYVEHMTDYDMDDILSLSLTISSMISNKPLTDIVYH